MHLDFSPSKMRFATEPRFNLITYDFVEGLPFEAIDIWHAFTIRLFRQTYLPNMTPNSVSLARPRPEGYEEQYRKSFGVEVSFDAPTCEICLDPGIVDIPLMGGNREIAYQNDRIIEEYLADLDKTDIISRVKQIIIQQLSTGQCSRRQVAAEMAMGPSALQHQLAERDSSFQDLLNQVRKSLALAYVEQARLSITEMSFMLGFAETSSFTRAFHRWTGMSPRDYRRSLHQED